MAEECPADSAALVLGLLAAADACGADPGQLARDAEIPGWALSAALPVMLPVRYARSIWELTEHALGTADVPLAMASRFVPGRFNVLDYLFATAPTVRDGLAAAADALHLWTTNGGCRSGLAMTARRPGHMIGVWRWAVGRKELSAQSGGVGDAARSAGNGIVGRAVTGDVCPRPASVSWRAARSARLSTAAFRVADDHDHLPCVRPRPPLRGADPVLSGILARYVRSLPAAPLADWQELFRVQLAHALARRHADADRGGPADGGQHPHGAATACRSTARPGEPNLRQCASGWPAIPGRAGRLWLADLGYADPRSLRRVLRQWESRP